MQLSVQGSARDAIRHLKYTVPKITKKAYTRAATTATKKVHTAVIREIAGTSGVQQKVIRKKFKHYKWSNRSKRARVWGGLNRISLTTVYKGARAKTGVSKFSQYVGASMAGKSAADAFTTTLRSGHKGFFVRRGSKRLPINEVMLDIESLGRNAVRSISRSLGNREFRKEFDRQMAIGFRGRRTKRFRR